MDILAGSPDNGSTVFTGFPDQVDVHSPTWRYCMVDHNDGKFARRNSGDFQEMYIAWGLNAGLGQKGGKYGTVVDVNYGERFLKGSYAVVSRIRATEAFFFS